jgi:hypothetical protein
MCGQFKDSFEMWLSLAVRAISCSKENESIAIIDETSDLLMLPDIHKVSQNYLLIRATECIQSYDFHSKIWFESKHEIELCKFSKTLINKIPARRTD